MNTTAEIETTTQAPTITNGVNVTALGDTINAVTNDPHIAQFHFRAKNRWINGGHNRTTIKEFYGAGEEDTTRTKPFTLDNGEPPVLLGDDEGPNPVEYVLNALAGCMTTTMVYHAAARGIQIESVESELEGDLDLHGFLGLNENVRQGYQNVRVKFKVKTDAPEEQLKELAKSSPVFDIVSNPVPVDVAIQTA
ncbi:MAG: OsmC family protein [Verrucomicrobiota bacterium]